MPFDLDEFEATPGEPTGEEVPADLEALRQQQAPQTAQGLPPSRLLPPRRQAPQLQAPMPQPTQNDQAASDLIYEVMQPKQQTAEEAIQVSADTYMDDVDKRQGWA